MIDSKSPAKIPVKKSDGTTVFLTMDEFREYKKKSTSVASPQSSVSSPLISKVQDTKQPKKLEQGKVEKIEVPLPMVADTHTELASTTPVKDIFFDEPKQQNTQKKFEKAPEEPQQKASEPVAPVIASVAKQSLPVSSPDAVPAELVAEAASAVSSSLPVEEKPRKDNNDTQKKEWKESDHASLLEEDLPPEDKPLPKVAPPDNGSKILSTVKSQFPFPISKDVEGRFDSLVLSRIRDIRTPLEVEQYAKMPKDQGGLGLEEDQARLLLAVIAAAQKISSPVAPTPVQRAITPVMNAVQSKPTPRIPLPQESEYTFAPPKPQTPTTPTGKPVLQDVVPSISQRRTMGPVDEIEFFSLVDFRRLSPKTENAKEILKGKFQSLQEESYVLFLDARDAWHKSPLFRTYQDMILSSLEQKIPLQNTLQQNSQGLTALELDALVEINHSLG